MHRIFIIVVMVELVILVASLSLSVCVCCMSEPTLCNRCMYSTATFVSVMRLCTQQHNKSPWVATTREVYFYRCSHWTVRSSSKYN